MAKDFFNYSKRESDLCKLEKDIRRARREYRRARWLTDRATRLTTKAIQAGYAADDYALAAMETFYGSTLSSESIPSDEVPSAENASVAATPTIPRIATSAHWTEWYTAMVNQEIAEEMAASAANDDTDD